VVHVGRLLGQELPDVAVPKKQRTANFGQFKQFFSLIK
jgi:hypothetical protein